MNSKSRFGYILIIPLLVSLGSVILYPITRSIYLSLTNHSLLMPNMTKFIGLKNYIQLFHDDTFWIATKNSLTLTFSAVTLQYLLGLGLAIALKQDVPGISFFRGTVMVSWVIPVVATVVMFKWMANPNYGFFNLVLQKIGLEGLTTYWFGSKLWAMPTIILMHLWRNVPFYGIALLAAMQGIPRQLYEAAQIDGAGRFQQFRHITLPGIKYMSMIMIVLHVLWTFNNFAFVYLSTGGGPVNRTEVLPVYVYQQSWENYDLGYATALGVTMMIIMMVFTATYVILTTEREL